VLPFRQWRGVAHRRPVRDALARWLTAGRLPSRRNGLRRGSGRTPNAGAARREPSWHSPRWRSGSSGSPQCLLAWWHGVDTIGTGLTAKQWLRVGLEPITRRALGSIPSSSVIGRRTHSELQRLSMRLAVSQRCSLI
jgi:hypothetical protein